MDRDIHLNGFWFSDDIRKLQEQQKLTVCDGDPNIAPWHDDEPEPWHVLTHEFGHVLSRGIKIRPFMNKEFKYIKNNPSLAVSGYALVDSDENFAEVFAAMHYGSIRALRNSQVRKLRWEIERLSRV